MYRVGNIITQSTPMHAQPHCTCLSIFDQEVFDAQLQENAELAEEWGVDIAAEWKEIVDGKDDAFQANSIEELAEQAGVEVQALKKAVDEYNAMCEAGRDDSVRQRCEVPQAHQDSTVLPCAHPRGHGGPARWRDHRIARSAPCSMTAGVWRTCSLSVWTP